MLRTQLLHLRQELDEYMQHLKKQTEDINLSKGHFLDEIKFLTSVDKLQIWPTQEMGQNSYLNILNSRVMQKTQPPKKISQLVQREFQDPEDCQNEAQFEEEVIQNLQQLTSNSMICCSKSKLPNPMKQIIIYQERPPEIDYKEQDQVMCVAYKYGQAESDCTLWTISSEGFRISYDLVQPDKIQITSHPQGQQSMSWEQ